MDYSTALAKRAYKGAGMINKQNDEIPTGYFRCEICEEVTVLTVRGQRCCSMAFYGIWIYKKTTGEGK